MTTAVLCMLLTSQSGELVFFHLDPEGTEQYNYTSAPSNIPVTREATGDISKDSLAAESVRRGGEFASNPGQEEQGPQKRSQQPQAQPGGGGLESQQSYAGPAPTYATNQRHRDPAGPHGRNLKDGGFEGSGTEAGSGPLPEPGSMEDPTRIATGLAAQGRKEAGTKQEGGVEGKMLVHGAGRG
ncbi:uncharacterized protein P884DRAFT_323284 [Thermothelomyces heterothallicus CBS 202.75]|uniref:uncharacterized protein n=1 Tax=Thermothelomyces heterothallicus CBS 202.75 TaxID=1149848 RepID=UPI0037428565